MRVVVVRHGKAHRDSPSGTDFDRALKPRGARQADYLGSCLAAMSPAPAVIVASPYVRALQTAHRIQAALDCDLRTDTRLEVGAGVGEIIGLLAEAHDAPSVCLVGHNPTLEALVATLLSGAASAPIRVRTGEAYLLDVDPRDAIGNATLAAELRLDE